MRRVNVCAEGNDWLFEDLKDRFRSTILPEVRVQVTETPATAADAWVFIRTAEASSSPDLNRTVVCIHDLYVHDDIYSPEGDRAAVRKARGLVLSHPEQRRLLAAAGISLEQKAVLERPLGALNIFAVRQSQPEVFTIGWVGRNHWRKRPEWLVECTRLLAHANGKFRVALIGKDLEDWATRIAGCSLYSRAQHCIDDYPRLYQALDCLLITSATEAGPLPLFEALATGIPVVSTPVGWAPLLASRGPNFVRLAPTPADLAAHLRQVRAERDLLFAQREEIAALAAKPRLDTWFREVVELALTLVP